MPYGSAKKSAKAPITTKDDEMNAIHEPSWYTTKALQRMTRSDVFLHAELHSLRVGYHRLEGIMRDWFQGDCTIYKRLLRALVVRYCHLLNSILREEQ